MHKTEIQLINFAKGVLMEGTKMRTIFKNGVFKQGKSKLKGRFVLRLRRTGRHGTLTVSCFTHPDFFHAKV